MAQTIELTPTYPVVEVEGRPLPLAWFGGLNTPQTQVEDLDGDGIDDLYFFDKAGEIHLAMRGDGNGNYEEAPELTKHFSDSFLLPVLITRQSKILILTATWT